MDSLLIVASKLIKLAEELINEIDTSLDAGKYLVENFDEEDLENFAVYYPDEYMYAYRGFIFPDGSMLEIGGGEDHRIINPDEWTPNRLVTYHKDNDLSVRFNAYPSWPQCEVVAKMAQSVNEVFIDFYDDYNRLGSIELPSYEVSAYGLEELANEYY